MADFNQVLTPGNYQDSEVTVVVEIPANDWAGGRGADPWRDEICR